MRIGQTDDELRSLARPVALDLNAAVVHFDQSLDQRQSDPQPALHDRSSEWST